MTRLRRLMVVVGVSAALLVGTAGVANAAGLCRFIYDRSGRLVGVECDSIA
jgi:hypothetical protein